MYRDLLRTLETSNEERPADLKSAAGRRYGVLDYYAENARWLRRILFHLRAGMVVDGGNFSGKTGGVSIRTNSCHNC